MPEHVRDGLKAWALMSGDAQTIVGWFRTRELAQQAARRFGCDNYEVRVGHPPKTADVREPEPTNDEAPIDDPLTGLDRYLLELQRRHLDELESRYGPLIRQGEPTAHDAFREAGLAYIRRYGGGFISIFFERFAPMLPAVVRDELCGHVIGLAAQGTVENVSPGSQQRASIPPQLISREQRLKGLLAEVTKQLNETGSADKPWWKQFLRR